MRPIRRAAGRQVRDLARLAPNRTVGPLHGNLFASAVSKQQVS